MAKKKPTSLPISTKPGQISSPGGQLSNYLIRNMPIWANPQWMNASMWRAFVQKQPIAVLCRDTLANHLLSLDWSIVSRDPETQGQDRTDIKYYTRLLDRANAYYSELDFTSHIEWIIRDLFDLPFGAASEIGRENDAPDGKTVWIRPLDAGTLYPTLNSDFPVSQQYPQYQPVLFPKENISRVYLSPRTEIIREGWGMPPPEKIYLAMEMINRGDVYYSELLLNTPEAGILDLMDMEKDTAEKWVNSFRDLLYGINALKIPVLYEHDTAAKWIPFGKMPSEIMYDTVTHRYISILAAGYGLTTSDIGFPATSSGGNSLSGVIRQERHSARSGFALAKKKTEGYFNKILPDNLMFHWIDYDDEKQVALSRARMADANAFNLFITNQIFAPDELRKQAISDGLVTVPVPEKLDRKSIEWPTNTLKYQGEKSGSNVGSNDIGSPVAPSGGGQGDLNPQQIISRNRAKFEVSVGKAVFAGNQILGALVNSIKVAPENDIPKWEEMFDNVVIGKSQGDLLTESVVADTYNAMIDVLERADWVDTVSNELAEEMFEKRSYKLKSQFEQALLKKAETEFIAGDRPDIILSPEEMDSVASLLPEYTKSDLFVEIRNSMTNRLVPEIILVSKSEIMNYKFDIDTRDFTDHNTIKLAREVSNKVFGLFPKLIEDVLLEINNKLDA
jgi:hypothetical protein